MAIDIYDDQNDESIPDSSLLSTANNILYLLGSSKKMTNDEELYSDKFYISTLSNILSDQKFDIQPGKTQKEKVKNLKKLIELLSEILEIDLSHISPESIIVKHDKSNAKSFLDLLEELIKTLMNAVNMEEEENEKENKESEKENKNSDNKKAKKKNENKSDSNSENNDNFVKLNNSEGNIYGGNNRIFNLDENDNVNNEEDNEDNDNFIIVDQKRLNKDEEININDLKKEQEKEEEKNKN